MLNAFESALKELGKKVEIHIYNDAGHGFMSQNSARYREADTKDAWEKIDAFFAKTLASGAVAVEPMTNFKLAVIAPSE